MVINGISARPRLGIVGLTLTRNVSSYYGLPIDRGILVTKVMDGSQAQHAGISTGDIILRMDNVVIYQIEDLLKEIHKRKFGEKVNVTILRKGLKLSFEITLTKIP